MPITVAARDLLAHRRLMREIEPYLDGELTPNAAAVLAAHLRSCWGCSGRAQTHRLLRAALRRTDPAAIEHLPALRLRRFAQSLADTALVDADRAGRAQSPPVAGSAPFGVLAHRTPLTAAPTVTARRPLGASMRRTPMSTSAAPTSTGHATPFALVPAITASITGGLAGGVVFGMLMQMMGMIGMVAQLVGSTSTPVGWIVHLVISAAIGGGFGLVGARFLTRTPAAIAAGAVYGMAWWVLGPLLLMPAKLGMPLFHLDSTAGQSLMGHLVFGMVLGAVAAVITRRRAR